MATASPTPNSSPSAAPPVSTPPPPPTSTTNPPPPEESSPPPGPSIASPPPQANVTTPSPPPPRTPSAVVVIPPSATPSTPPPQPPVESPPPTTSPPPPSPNVDPPPPPVQSSSPPPIVSPPPSTPANPPASPTPPTSPPPQPSTPPPENPPPPAVPSPPQKSPSPPPPPSNPPEKSPPPPTTPSQPPTSSPPPPISVPPPRRSPPPPSSTPPEVNPPPPPQASTPPENSPPPPASIAPTSPNAPPPPADIPTPPSQPTPAPSNSTPGASSPSPPLIRMSPPPPSLSSPPSSGNNTIPGAPESSNSKNEGIDTGGIVAIGVVVGFIMLGLLGLTVWCMRKQRKQAPRAAGGFILPSSLGSSPRADSNFTKAQTTVPLMGSGSSPEYGYSPSGSGGLGNSRPWFTYDELHNATNGFSSQNLLGEGGFGSVYKGSLPDGREVAVKQLKIGGGQGEREFKAEVEIISRIHHRHLVSLVGYCISDNRRLLVYDYVSNNTLHFHLHGEGSPVLDWTSRVKVAAGAARGIAYLHEDCHPRIIHRDIKTSNILLDNNFEAKVSDFGLAKLALDANTHVTTRVMGTFGYMAPEYASSGKLTDKSDVFSYGVVLLELITGRKPVDSSQPIGDESLVQWARPLLGHALANEEFNGLVDPRLKNNFVESEMFIMIEAAAACVRHSAAKRPRMGQVVRAFDGLATADLSNGMRVGESEVFNSAQQSAEIRLFQRMAFGSQNYSTDFYSQISLDS